jgi:hypothetical protein
MRYRTLLLLFILPVISGCDNYFPEKMDFPIIKTLTPVDIDQSGATLLADIVQAGSAEMNSYGFALSNLGEPEDHEAFKVIVGEKTDEGIFKVRLEHALVNGLEYKIRAFATFNGKTVYGNEVKIQSLGSQKCPWSVRLKDIYLNGWFYTYSSATDEKGIIVFQSSNAYEYDPEKNVISSISNFPLTGNSGTKFAFANYNNSIYCIHNINNQIYKFSTGAWSFITDGQYNLSTFTPYIGLTSQGKVYALSTAQSLSFDPLTNNMSQWNPFSVYPGGFAGGCQLQDTAYFVMANNKLWKAVNPFTTWIMIGTFPGILGGKVFSFEAAGKIYFGSAGNRNVWAWNTATKTWSEIDQFPVVAGSDLFCFTIKNRTYIGILTSGSNYTIVEFDPSKI